MIMFLVIIMVELEINYYNINDGYFGNDGDIFLLNSNEWGGVMKFNCVGGHFPFIRIYDDILFNENDSLWLTIYC